MSNSEQREVELAERYCSGGGYYGEDRAIAHCAFLAGYDASQKEVDELRQEMSTSAEAIVRLGDEYARLREERDHLRAENAELRAQLLKHTSVSSNGENSDYRSPG